MNAAARLRYPLAPWSDVALSDLRGQGAPELVRDLRGERQLGLAITGTTGVVLGILAIRCERSAGDVLIPLSVAIAPTPIPLSTDDPA